MRDKLQVGQKLWFKPDAAKTYIKAEELTVKKVGRKWAYCDNERYRIDVGTLDVEWGFTRVGVCFFDRAVCEHEDKRIAAFGKLRQMVSQMYRAPNHLSLEDIEVVLDLLSGKKAQKGGA